MEEFVSYKSRYARKGKIKYRRATYKIRRRVFLFYESLKSRKRRIFVPTSYIQGHVRGSLWVSQALNQEFFFFWFTSIWVWKRPVSFEVSAPTRLSLRGSHVRRKFRKWTTLRSEGSTLIGLFNAGWRSRCEVFVARKAALSPWSEAWARKLSNDKRQSTFFHELGILTDS